MRIVSKTTSQVAFFAASFIFLSGFGSCSQTVEQVCRTQIPELQKKIETARLDVGGISLSEGRAIASIEGAPKLKHLSLSQKSDWQLWAEFRLKEVQLYLDKVKAEPRLSHVARPVRDELTLVADELVAFDGYTERSQLKYMKRSLATAQEHLDKAVQLACGLPLK